ncbi:MAG TPA: hypothetical protein VF283_17125 [Bryobacteraceae bacterium]
MPANTWTPAALPKSAAEPPGVVPQMTVRAPRWAWLCAGGAFCLFLCLAAGYVLTRSPWWDEGVFADVAMNFRNHGHLGSSLLAPHGYNNMPGVHRYTYWQFPLYLISLGVWFRILPPTIEAMRLFSLFWACIYLAAWFFFVRALSRNETLALVTSSIIALAYIFVQDASDGRMETMCAALGQAALAVYVCQRDRNHTLAVALAGCLGAASLFCHPMGAVTNAFLAILLLRDWRRFRRRDLAVFCAPYLLGGALCLWYIVQAPEIFVAQYKAASGYRVTGFAALLKRACSDFDIRYFQACFAGQGRLKPLVLLFGLAGFVAVALSRRLRSIPPARLLFLYSCIGYLGVALIDNQKFWYYLIYSMPMLYACGAAWLYDSWKRRTLGRFLAAVLLAGAVGSTCTAFRANVQRDTFRNSYEPALAAIKHYLRPGGFVMAPSEFGFALGWGPPLIDDCYLGYHSGIRPDVYVMHNDCDPGRYPETHRAWKWSREMLAKNYKLVQTERTFWPYWIYVRKDLLRPAGTP